jgi:hypothetical protein
MHNNTRSQAKRAAASLFQTETRPAFESALVDFTDVLDALSNGRQYRIIADALDHMEELLEGMNHVAHAARPEILSLIASHLPLRATLIKGLLLDYHISAEHRLALAQNMVRQESYNAGISLGDWFEDDWRDDNEEVVICILSGLLKYQSGETLDTWALTAAITHAFSEDSLPRLRQWFVEQEATILTLDTKQIMGNGWFMSEARHVFEGGLVGLGRRMLANSLAQAEGYDLVSFEHLMGRQLTLAEFGVADPEPQLCYLLASSHSIEECLAHTSDWKITRLLNALRCNSQATIASDRLQQVVIQCCLKDSDSFDQFSSLKQLLKEQGRVLEQQTLYRIYVALIKRQMSKPGAFALIYFWARKDGLVLDVTRFAKTLEKSLLSAVPNVGCAQFIHLCKGVEAGLPFPQSFFDSVLKRQYPGWSSKDKAQLHKKAPEWLLSASEFLREEKLLTELGI